LLAGQVISSVAGPDRDAEIDEEVVKQPQTKFNEALVALQKFRLYKEQQSDVITTLLRHQRRIQGRRPQNTKQKSISMYFGVADRSITTSRA